MFISVDFWKSMHGFAMDSRTRATMFIQVRLERTETNTFELGQRVNSHFVKKNLNQQHFTKIKRLDS